ncbi:uncharacterized protein LOC106667297 [Cimex lectularius]|uniref:Chitin-binding type-2 domain-containing protein n=1 Tax=Cimex lectularius TaxID=79782 RepID=A0A8I6RSM5_CIMLE|nr:uncharacterized protein LOC106667297 [Cimex lectularius]
MMKAGLLFLAIIGLSLAFYCEEKKTYDSPDEENCRYYHHCESGESSEGACFIFFRKFNPVTLKCDWAWNVDCTAKPAKLPPS